MATPEALENEDRLITAARDVLRASVIDINELAAALSDLKTALQPWADSDYNDYLAEVKRRLQRDLTDAEVAQVDTFYAAGHTTRQTAAALA
ncbi:MAG: hypothetical protein ACFCVD_02110 [Nodosilinea sp.]